MDWDRMNRRAERAAMSLRSGLLDRYDGKARLEMALFHADPVWSSLSTGEREFLTTINALLDLRGRLSSVDAGLMRELFEVADEVFRPRRKPQAVLDAEERVRRYAAAEAQADDAAGRL